MKCDFARNSFTTPAEKSVTHLAIIFCTTPVELSSTCGTSTCIFHFQVTDFAFKLCYRFGLCPFSVSWLLMLLTLMASTDATTISDGRCWCWPVALSKRNSQQQQQHRPCSLGSLNHLRPAPVCFLVCTFALLMFTP